MKSDVGELGGRRAVPNLLVEDEGAAASQDAPHLRENARRIREMVKRAADGPRVERFVLEGHCAGIGDDESNGPPGSECLHEGVCSGI